MYQFCILDLVQWQGKQTIGIMLPTPRINTKHTDKHCDIIHTKINDCHKYYTSLAASYVLVASLRGRVQNNI